MKINQIVEGAEEDVQAAGEVRNALNMVRKHLARLSKHRGTNTEGLETRYRGDKALLLRPHVTGLGAVSGFKTVTLVIARNLDSDGSFIPVLSALKSPVIFIKSDIHEDKPFNLASWELDTLYHELVHAHQFFKRNIEGDGYADHDPDNEAPYYNDPRETDARFHELIKDIAQATDLIKKRGDDETFRTQIMPNIAKDVPLDFVKFLERSKAGIEYGMITQGRALWYYGLPKVLKRTVSRMYKVHKEYVNAYKNAGE